MTTIEKLTAAASLLCWAIAAWLISPAARAETYPGPYRIEVIRVIDGDTILVNAHAWPGIHIRTSLRLDGIDTPEKGWRAQCPAERKAGETATAYTQQWLRQHSNLQATHIRRGKYAGRILGQIVSGPNNLADDLLQAGHARPYNGRKRGGWCSTKTGTDENTTTQDRALNGRAWPTQTHKPAPAATSSERRAL